METKKMINCPSCCKPVLREGSFGFNTEFSIKCPWCQASLKIEVQPKIIAHLVEPAMVSKIFANEIPAPPTNQYRD